MTFDDAALLLLSDPHHSVGVGATEEEIESASQTLRAPISGGYRTFLRRFGWGGVPAYRLYGLGGDVPKRFHLVLITESERTEMCPQVPEHLLPIMNDGGGNLVCLDTKASPDEPPVVIWYHDDPDGSEQVPASEAPDFLSWFAKILAERGEGRTGP